MNILSIRDLTVSFGRKGDRRPVVHGVSFDVKEGETLAVVGGSGSGKSVTAMSVMQLLDPRYSEVSGQAMFGGQNLLTMGERAMQDVRGNKIGMIFQEPMTSLNPVLTIGYQLCEALRRHRGLSRGESLRTAGELLEKVRIPAAQKRLSEYPHRLSGGMRQRVMIAMALACRPRLLIADEPTTALDVTVQAQIIDLMRMLQQEEGTSILFITHDMGVVAEMADRTIVMHNGRMIEENATVDLFRSARDPYTRGLLTAVPQLGSMKGEPLPRPFPQIDPETGDAGETAPSSDTVRHDVAPALAVNGLTTRFDIPSGIMRRVRERVHAVENVDFSLQPGETLALVGESGCGKSTLGRSVMHLTRPIAGEIIMDGRTASYGDLGDMRSNIQMVFQDPFASLNPRIRVGDSIAAPLVINKVMTVANAAKRARELLAMVGLSTEMADRFPHEFSGGQRQRICIARALALNPRVIVADEAVSALDVAVKTQVLNLMLDLQSRLGLAFLFISHDMAVVERVAHRVAVMYLGEIVETGPRSAIFENPRHPYTRRLLAAVPIPDPSRRRAPKSPSNAEIRNPVRPVDYVPDNLPLREVAPQHFVRDWRPADWPTHA